MSLSITQPRNKNNAIIASVLLTVAGVARFPTDDFRMEMQMLFQAAAILLLCVFLWRLNKWIALFLALCLVSMFFPFYTRHSYLAFQGVFYAVIWFALLTFCVNDGNDHFLLNGLCLIAFANILFLILQYFNLDPLFKAVNGSSLDPPTGLMGNRNFVSAILAFCFPAFLRPGWRWGIPAVFLGLVLAKSTGGVMAVAAGWIFYGVMKDNALVPLLTVALGILLYTLFVDKPDFFGARWEVWKNAIGYYKQHYILGSGLGHWKIVFKKYALYETSWWSTAHNEILQAVFEMGVGFIVILAGYIQEMIRRYQRRALIPATALIIIFINSLVNFPFHIATTAMIAVTWMALMEIRLQTGVQNEDLQA